MNHRKNNFDFLRLIFASFVIVTHSYPISGVAECDPLCQLSGELVGFSYFGVRGFFVISGYLIFQSLTRSDNIIDYFWKRILRLFPGLFVVLLITVLLAPFVYQSNIPYWKNTSVLTYIPKNLSLYQSQIAIDGVFTTNPFNPAINGSLWTIPYEFTLYVLISVLIILRKNNIAIRVILSLFFFLLVVGNIYFPEQAGQYRFILSSKHMLDFGAFFMAGALLAAVNIDQISFKKELLSVVVVLVTLSVHFQFFSYSKYFTLPVLFIVFGLNPMPFISDIGNKIGDLSYGIYVYGYPVQQTLMYYFKMKHLELMIYSLIISFVLAYFSWHLVEKRALKLKKIRILARWLPGKAVRRSLVDRET